MPRVVQKPHPPIWIAAISTEESFVYAAKNGYNLMIVPYAGKPGQLQELVRMYRRMVASILATTPEKVIAQGGAFVGSPEEVVEQVKQCKDAFDGPIEPSMQINFGGSSDAEAMRTLELLASKVVPQFR